MNLVHHSRRSVRLKLVGEHRPLMNMSWVLCCAYVFPVNKSLSYAKKRDVPLVHCFCCFIIYFLCYDRSTSPFLNNSCCSKDCSCIRDYNTVLTTHFWSTCHLTQIYPLSVFVTYRKSVALILSHMLVFLSCDSSSSVFLGFFT